LRKRDYNISSTTNATSKNGCCNKKNYYNIGEESVVTMRKSYYNISSTTSATSEKKNTYCNKKNLLQHKGRICCNNVKKQNETSQELFCNIREMLVATTKKVPLQHSTSSIAILKMNYCKNNDEI